TVSTGFQGGRPYLAVEDTGPGIPEGERQRVRQRFYRLPNSVGHGSGLGLAIVDEIDPLYGASVTLLTGANSRGTVVLVQFKDSAAPGLYLSRPSLPAVLRTAARTALAGR